MVLSVLVLTSVCTRTCSCPLRILLQLLAWVCRRGSEWMWSAGCVCFTQSLCDWLLHICKAQGECYPFQWGCSRQHTELKAAYACWWKPEIPAALHKGSLLFFPVADHPFFIGGSVGTFSVPPQLSCWSTWPRYRKFALNHFFLSCLGRAECWALVLAPGVLPQQCSEEFLLCLCVGSSDNY